MGLFGWFKKSTPKYQNISVAEFKEIKAANKSAVILDVRSLSETKAGAIKGHKQLDVMAGGFKTKLAGLDQAATYLVYCKSEMRSRRACGIMAKNGFSNLYNLKGGYLAWQNEA